MGRLDELVRQGEESNKMLTVRVGQDVADELKAQAKQLGTSRTKLVNELFMAGLEEFRSKFTGNGASADAAE